MSGGDGSIRAAWPAPTLVNVTHALVTNVMTR
jgi:hypothetical protein